MQVRCRVLVARGEGLATTTLTEFAFHQDVSAAMRAACEGPVFVTERGRATHVLLTIEAYQRIVGGGASIVDLLAFPGAEVVDFEPPRADVRSRMADLS